MFRTCDMVWRMSKMIQIRNVPDDVHREAKVRAARAGMSLSDFLLAELKRTLALPPVDELLDRIAQRQRPALAETPAEAVRAERSAR